MSNTRDKVLKTLLSRQRSTINELSESVGISPISVRHHINKLEALGFVSFVEERHGVGRPRNIYFLTEKGLEQFPTRYLRLTIRLLQQLKETLPKKMVGELFSQMAGEIATDFASDLDLEDLPIEKRLDIARDLLNAEGFTMEWESKDGSYYIHEVNCPYHHVGQSHPEVCAVDETLISTLLSVPIKKVKCILDGDSYCTYVVQNLKSEMKKG